MKALMSMAGAMAEIDRLMARLEILQDAADNGVLVTRAETEQMDDVIHDALWGCK